VASGVAAGDDGNRQADQERYDVRVPAYPHPIHLGAGYAGLGGLQQEES
jgi:hypothetical protein